MHCDILSSKIMHASSRGFLEKHMDKIRNYITDALQELHHVRWPTRHQAVRLSGIVVGFVAASTAVFGAVDFGLSQAVTLLLSLT